LPKLLNFQALDEIAKISYPLSTTSQLPHESSFLIALPEVKSST